MFLRPHFITILLPILFMTLDVKSYAKDRITITGQRPGNALIVHPASMQIISSQEIKTKGYRYLDEILRDVAGITVVKDANLGGNASIFIRGASSGQTLVLIDGVRINDSSATNAGFSNGSLLAANIERIEILKGSQSVIYGSSAIGGIINIVTKQNEQLSPLQFDYNLEVGERDSYRSALSLSGYTQQRSRYHAAFSGLHSSGYSAAQDESATAPDDDGISQMNGQLSWSFPIDNHSSVKMQYRRDYAQLELDLGAGQDDPNYTSSNQQELASLHMDRSFWDGLFTSDFELSLLQIKRNYDNKADSINDSSMKLNYKGQTYNAALINNLLLEKALLTVGGEWIREQSESSSEFANTPQQNPNQSLDTLSLFATSKWQLSDWLTLDTGVRHDTYEAIESVQTYQVGATFNAQTLLPIPILELNHATGFKTPSLEQLYSEYGSKNLKSEKSSSWEVSLQQQLNTWLQIQLSYFYYQFRNLIDFDENFKYVNVQNAISKGLESTINLSLTHYLNLRLQHTYLHARDLDSGLALPRRPTNQWGLFLNAQWRNWNFALTSIARSPLPGNSFSPDTAESFNVDARIAYQLTPTHEVWLRIENLSKESSPFLEGYTRTPRSVFIGLAGQI